MATTKGVVTLDGEEIGTFEMEVHDISVNLNWTKGSLEELMEFAAENGMTIALALKPDFDEYTPKHQE